MELIGGAIVGAAAVLFGPGLLGGIGAVVRPAVKGAIKGGMAAYDSVAGAAAGISESMGDLVAEVKGEAESATGAGADGGQAAVPRRRRS